MPLSPFLRLVPALPCLVALGFARTAGAAHPISPPVLETDSILPWPSGLEDPDVLSVPVQVTVEVDGSVSEVEVEHAPNDAWANAARRAAFAWRFKPAIVHGEPRAARVRALVQFRRPQKATETGSPPAPIPLVVPVAPLAEPEEDTVRVWVEGHAPARSASSVVREHDHLHAAPHRDGSELLLTVPGVFLTQHGGEGKAHQIFLRGFDAVHGQDLELWAAGAPVNDVSNIHGQGYSDLHFLIPEVVHEVDAQPGTYDPRQGDFAIAGTARFRLGMHDEGFTLGHAIGSFGGRRTLLAYRPEGQPVDTFAAFEAYETDGFGPSRATRRLSWIGQAIVPVGARTRIRTMASLYAGRFDAAGVVPLAWIDEGQIDRFGVWIDGQGGRSSRAQVVVDIGTQDDDSEWAIAPFFVHRSLSLRQNFTGWLDDPTYGDMTQQRNDATTTGATAWMRRRMKLLSDHDRLEVGAVVRADDIEQSQRRIADADGRETATLVDADVRAAHVGAYADAALHPISRVVVRGGVRLDGLSYQVDDHSNGEGSRSSQGHATSLRGAVDLAVLSGLHALVSYGEGFRSPQARSLGDGETAPFTTSRSYEAGLRYGSGSRFQAAMAAFQTRLSRDLVFDHATGRNESVPGTTRTGAVMDLVVRPNAWLLSSASVTYSRAVFRSTEGEYQNGFFLPYVPQVVARSDTSVRPELARALGDPVMGRLGIGTTLLARRPLPYGEMGRDVMLADVGVGARWRALQLDVDVYNLLDASWLDGEFVYASATRGGAPSLVPQRHVTVGAPRTLWVMGTLHL